MATKKTNEEEKQLNTSEPSEKKTTSRRKKSTENISSTPSESGEIKPKRSYSWKSSVKKTVEILPDDDLDLKDLGYQERRRYKQDTDQRKSLASWTIGIISAWLFSVVVIFVLIGIGVLSFNDSVIITLLSTTTANILALGLVVLKGIFKDNSPTNLT
ncbi:MAG: hypothetical protein IKQ46_03730 [Bacteroidales bacterium]|nr:hypothetical protein [Bacteroidales bacterium]